jgi:hypothetical protein
MSFDAAIAVADAVLLEGYVLYPYRASAQKNQVRWQFGVVAPPAWSPVGSEPSYQRTECLLEPDADPVLHLRVRFLQVQSKQVHERDGEDLRPVARLAVDDAEHVSWDEGVLREVDAVLSLADLLAGERTMPFTVPGSEASEPLIDRAGRERGAVVRTSVLVEGQIRLGAEVLPGPYGVVRLRCRVENVSSWSDTSAGRREALARSMVACHALLAITGGRFLSLLDPPEWARTFARECVNEHVFPVLVGDRDRRDLLLSSPIILYDFPEVAAESPGDLFDATEIDELLLLRTMTLTDEEKREARATDPRAAEIIDRADHLPPEVLARLHGAIRSLEVAPRRVGDAAERETPPGSGSGRSAWWDPGSDASVSPETDAVLVDGVPVARGSRVRLRPRPGADAQDMFLAGRTALVEAVFFDVDGGTHLAVSLEDDEAADLRRAHGRFLYFTPEELEPLDREEAP